MFFRHLLVSSFFCIFSSAIFAVNIIQAKEISISHSEDKLKIYGQQLHFCRGSETCVALAIPDKFHSNTAVSAHYIPCERNPFLMIKVVNKGAEYFLLGLNDGASKVFAIDGSNAADIWAVSKDGEHLYGISSLKDGNQNFLNTYDLSSNSSPTKIIASYSINAGIPLALRVADNESKHLQLLLTSRNYKAWYSPVQSFYYGTEGSLESTATTSYDANQSIVRFSNDGKTMIVEPRNTELRQSIATTTMLDVPAY